MFYQFKPSTPNPDNHGSVTREDSTHGDHQMVRTEIRLIIFFVAKDGDSIQSAKTRLGADCGYIMSSL